MRLPVCNCFATEVCVNLPLTNYIFLAFSQVILIRCSFANVFESSCLFSCLKCC